VVEMPVRICLFFCLDKGISIARGEDECLFLNDIGKIFTNSVFCRCNWDWTESVGSVPHIVSVAHFINFIACRLDRKTGTNFVNVGFLCAFPGGMRFFEGVHHAFRDYWCRQSRHFFCFSHAFSCWGYSLFHKRTYDAAGAVP